MKKAVGSKAGTTAAMMMFCIFAMSVLTVLMLGAGVYRNIIETSQENYEARIGMSYIWSKVKNKDDGGEIRIGEFHGRPTLYFEDIYGGKLYHTLIYSYDGWLRELFFEDGIDFLPGDGNPIIRIDAFNLEQQTDGSVSVTVGSKNPITESLLLTARTGAYRDDGYE
jgi:hypothetical protein